MLPQVDASPLYWPRLVASLGRVIFYSAVRLWWWTKHHAGKIRVKQVARQKQIDCLARKIGHLESEHEALIGLFERVVDQRDHYYHLYLQALRDRTAA